jgi:UDP-N-acetylmuramoyl-L-alanyl-D-glutamate--2,6-diaminopimelate ligase
MASCLSRVISTSLIWIDYACTPDAIENAIITLQQHYPTHNNRVVFGCGGNLDQDKRAKMGKSASKHANTLILTNDNPRDENPQAIINDILIHQVCDTGSKCQAWFAQSVVQND